MYNTKFVHKLAFAYHRNCPLSLGTTKHFQAYINGLFIHQNGRLTDGR